MFILVGKPPDYKGKARLHFMLRVVNHNLIITLLTVVTYLKTSLCKISKQVVFGNKTTTTRQKYINKELIQKYKNNRKYYRFGISNTLL